MEPEPGQLRHASSIGMECVQGIVAGMHSGQVHQLTICLLHGRADGLVVGGQTLHKTGEGALSPWNGTQNQCAAADLCVGIGLPKTGEQLLVFPEEPFWRHIKIGVVEPGIEKDVVWRDAIDGKLCNSPRGPAVEMVLPEMERLERSLPWRARITCIHQVSSTVCTPVAAPRSGE